jgi:hypothetical protein
MIATPHDPSGAHLFCLNHVLIDLKYGSIDEDTTFWTMVQIWG